MSVGENDHTMAGATRAPVAARSISSVGPLKLVAIVVAGLAGTLASRGNQWTALTAAGTAAVILIIVPVIVEFVAGLLARPAQGDESDAPILDAERAERNAPGWAPFRPEQLRQSLLLGDLQLWALAAIAVADRWFALGVLQQPSNLILFAVVGTMAILSPAIGFGIEAVQAGKLPPRAGGQPQHNHITGFGALFLGLAIVGIIVLATVATTDRYIDREIHAQWGAWIVFGLIGIFVAAAMVPGFGVPAWLSRAVEGVSSLLRPLGRLLSVIDSLLVYCIAPSLGATLKRRWAGRYLGLLAYLVPLGTMGYWLPAPFGLLPLTWALLAAIAVSRRWAWIEDDRETAMLTAQFRSENLKVGFEQDLRDEALLAFTAMFVLVPLALRQVHLWGAVSGAEVFSIRGTSADDLYSWIQFFGSELAKAAPIVDWAEVYNVHGEGPIEVHSRLSQHVVFGTRVLVDLVFLATLLQVLSTFSRNARQIEMLNDGAIDRYDPFIERTQFQRLVRWDGRWVPQQDTLDKFGRRRRYSLTRLLELRESKQAALRSQGDAGAGDRRSAEWAVWAAADSIYERDYQDGELVAQLYEQLRVEAGTESGKVPNKDAIASLLDELEKPTRARQLSDLDDVRTRLNSYATAWPLRQRIISLIGRPVEDGDERVEQISFLAAALAGERTADPRAPNRRLAFEALKEAYDDGEPSAVTAMKRAALSDGSGQLMKEIQAFINSRPPPAIKQDPSAVQFDRPQ